MKILPLVGNDTVDTILWILTILLVVLAVILGLLMFRKSSKHVVMRKVKNMANVFASLHDIEIKHVKQMIESNMESNNISERDIKSIVEFTLHFMVEKGKLSHSIRDHLIQYSHDYSDYLNSWIILEIAFYFRRNDTKHDLDKVKSKTWSEKEESVKFNHYMKAIFVYIEKMKEEQQSAIELTPCGMYSQTERKSI